MPIVPAGANFAADPPEEGRLVRVGNMLQVKHLAEVMMVENHDGRGKPTILEHGLFLARYSCGSRITNKSARYSGHKMGSEY